MSKSVVKHSEREHAEWAASATDRWLACPYSVDTETEKTPTNAPAFWCEPVVENPGNFHTARGTRMHEEADRVLREWAKSAFTRIVWHNNPLTFTNPENGEKCLLEPDEWKAHVQPFVFKIRDIYEECGMLYGEANVEFFNEVRVNVWGSECWGSTDAAIVCPDTLYVVDLKCGSRLVGADSGQNKTYACGLHNRFNRRFKEIHLCIAQAENTAGGGWAEAIVSGDDLVAHFERIKAAIGLSKKAKREGRVPGAECINAYCDWCPKLHVCPAHHDRALAALDMADAPKKVATLPLGKVRKLVELAPLLRKLLDAAEKRLFELTELGEETGYKIVEGRSNRRWRKELKEEEIAAAIAALAEFDGEPFDVYKKSLVSFTAVEERFGKGSIDELLEKPPGKPTLVPVGDRREALDQLDVLREGV